mgnify:CR=1 FL=1
MNFTLTGLCDKLSKAVMHSVQGIEGTDIKRTGVLPEGTPHCAGEDPPDAKQHHFHGKVETGMVWGAGMEAMIIMTIPGTMR